ncbi:FkbM family methyltransferase [Methylomonas paludis]|uniref:FkbM family methyltransferase n=1 Tax=Methylomonas paludis TaxID=1173101 RepID=A0A975MMG4_9GAMM|nr:FkbM family methyltransferase [Methylomonas paludis]QWF70319.1 FkbM family methyltransferase [Methylomonas paludis]
MDSEYGRFIVNRHCSFQAESLVKTGRPHIQSELDNILAVIKQLPDNCVIVDAGANIGLVSIPIAQAVLPRNGLVYAFEVQRMLFYALCGSAALNDLDNLIVKNLALGSTAGLLHAGKPDYSQAQDFGLFSLVNQAENQAEQIEVVTIDSLGLPRLDFLKIDVEGMEIDVLKGSRNTIQQHLPWCWIEYWKVDIADIKAQFAGLEYKFYLMDSLNMLCVPISKFDSSTLSIQIKAE